MVRIGGCELARGRACIAATVTSLEQAAQAGNEGADILELRIDLLNDQDEGGVLNLITEIRNAVGLPIIITNRSSEEGGKFKGSDEERLSLLLKAIPLADAVDIELRSDGLNKIIGAAKKSGKTSIVSCHDFEATPGREQFFSIANEMGRSGADIGKIAVMIRAPEDALLLLDVVLHTTVDRKVCFCMAMNSERLIGENMRLVRRKLSNVSN